MSVTASPSGSLLVALHWRTLFINAGFGDRETTGGLGARFVINVLALLVALEALASATVASHVISSPLDAVVVVNVMVGEVPSNVPEVVFLHMYP